MILVCGATGTIGRRVMTSLAAKGVRARGMIRNSPQQPTPLAEFVIADLLKPESLKPLFAEIEAVFLLSPVSARQLEMEQNVVRVAIADGVKRIVKLSVLKAGVDSSFTFGQIHGQIEQQIAASPCEWTFLRPNMMMQNLLWYKDALKNGVLPLALGQAPVSHIDAEDIASVVTTVLTSVGHSGKVYDLTGPQSLTGNQLAGILSSELNRPTRYEAISINFMKEQLLKNGAPEFDANAEGDLFDLWSHGAGDVLSDSVRSLLGREAINAEQFTRREYAQFVL